jgi:hypothetical protein
MADCNNCSSYLSSEDIIRRSVKCSGGSVAFIGSLLIQIPEGNYLISLEGEFLTEVDNEENLLTEIEEE